MEDVEAGFISRMNALIAQGMDFEKVVRKTLRESMGETPSEVFFLGLGEGALVDPAILTKELIATFGQAGVDSVYDSIEHHAMEGSWRAGEGESVESLLESIVGPEVSAPPKKKDLKKRYLHDHRIPEDIDEYFARSSAADGHESTGNETG